MDPQELLRPDPPPGVRGRALGLLAELGLSLRSAGLLVAAAVVVLGVGWWFLRAPAAPPAEAGLPLSTVPVTSTTPPSSEVVAHAAGAVVQPGVYHLAVGSRVSDLIDLAGGFAPRADGDRLNLAGLLEDGVRVYVPRRGEAAAPALDVTGSEDNGAEGGELVNVNTAGLEELDTLPGVGPATGQAIIDHRSSDGPFATVEDLLGVRGIGDAKLADLRDRVTV